jgi:type IX secretion system PorP/SprF family membrane protein
MMKKIYFAGIVLVMASTLQLKAQDIHFSQINESQMFLSPASTGFFNGYIRASANYRNQWSAMNNAFSTSAIAVDGGLFRSKKRPAFMGLGLTFFNDQAGVAKLRKTSVLLNVSAILKLGKNSALSVGLAGGTTGMNANYSALTYESQFNGNTLDPASANGEQVYRQFTTVDVGAGMAYEYGTSKRDQDHDDVRSIKLSLGAYHLNRPAQNFGPGSDFREAIRYTAALFTVFDLEDTKFTISPTAVYHMQGTFSELTMGTNIRFRTNAGTKVTGTKTQNAIGIGMYYRVNDALIPMLTFDLGDYSFGMSYDVNLSGYRAATNYRGGFEISLRYNNLASSLFESRREFR